MPFKDVYSYQEALRALQSLDEARAALEAAQTAFEDAARQDDAARTAETVIGGIEDLLCDLETSIDPLRTRLDAFDEFDRESWAAH